MSTTVVNKYLAALAFVVGLVVVAWVALGFAGHHPLALAMTLAIALVYLVGARELWHAGSEAVAARAVFQRTRELPADLEGWLADLPRTWGTAVRQRLDGERVPPGGPALTPYLVGLLVMLGMLGTFLGMVMTFRGAVLALEGSADLQAIRAALAAPVKGLGLSFGTSVAGVAASAMLGLMLALVRRERAAALQALERCVRVVLQPHTRAHRRDQAYEAVQAQARMWPVLAERLQSVAEAMERQGQQANEQALARQAAFHEANQRVYGELAARVETALKDSLVAGAQAAGEALRPVVGQAMQAMAEETRRLHQEQVTWVRTELDRLLETFQQTINRWRVEQAEAEGARLGAWSEAWAASTESLSSRWSGQVQEVVTAAECLLAQTEALVQARTAAEATWQREQSDRAQASAAWLKEAIATLRAEEAARGDAAVQRLAELEGAVTQHLAQLGQSLEAPLHRLLQSAAEVPASAAQVLTELQDAVSRWSDRDRTDLAERGRLMQQLDELMGALRATSVGVSDDLRAQAVQVAQAAGHVQASAVELSAWGDSFARGVQAYGSSSEQVLETLRDLESALRDAMARSDDQLAYYVAQAREVIDLSIAAQQGMLQDLQRWREDAARRTEEAAA